MKPYFFILLGVILFTCKKSPNSYSITVLVSDWDSHVPIQGAKVYVFPVYSQGPSIPMDTGFTDANGKVSFSVKKQGESIFVSAKKGNYFSPPIFFPLIRMPIKQSLFL